MYTIRLRSVLMSALLFGAALTMGTRTAQSQTTDEKISAANDKIAGHEERITTLETSVANLQRLKISGYVQPQWQWADIDSLGNQTLARNSFTIRRGRIKFQHSTGNVSYLLYPDITENGVILKEAYAGWKPVPEFEVTMGSMNRPFGYEIAYSSSAREVTERSLAENRLFNGERDLGLQFAITPTVGGIKPVIELGLFNGSDNFAKGPVVFNSVNYTNAAFTTAGVGSQAAVALGGSSADTARIKLINASIGNEAALFNGGYRQSDKELLGHIRLPFLVSDDFSFDIGGSISMGGINEPSDLRADYSGASGALVIAQNGKGPNTAFNAKSGSVSSGFLESNRSVIGVDGQFYLSVLPIGGTILKGEMYTGHVPFYGTSALFTNADVTAFGAPRPMVVEKNVMGFYAMLVQNITDMFQLAIRYDVFDPNTDVAGSDFFTTAALRGVSASAGFGGDLKQSTLTVDANIFISGALRLMLDYDMVKTEDFTKGVAGAPVTVSDPHDDRFTFRMQYKF